MVRLQRSSLFLNEIVNILHSFDCNFNKVIYWYLWLNKNYYIKIKGKEQTDFSFKCKNFNVSGIGEIYKSEWFGIAGDNIR